jgi:coenzyme F420 hydrogenase subunit beta
MKRIFDHLVEEVINPGFCVGCGACVAVCPIRCLDQQDETPRLTGVCINCTICYGSCPELVDHRVFQKDIFGGEPADDLLGTYIKALSVEAVDQNVKARCQDGGAVTSLLSSLLEAGYIDGAVLIGTGREPWHPVARVAKTPEEVINCAGSKYTLAPVFIGLQEAVDLYYCERLAVVGTPCHILASWRMKFSNPANRHLGDAIKLRVGLFCGGIFGYNELRTNIIDEQLHTSLAEVVKFDFREDKFIIHQKNKSRRELDLDLVKQHLNLSCKLCRDFAAEMADISVGAAGSPPGRSTVLLRTSTGSEAFEIAERSGGLDVIGLERVSPGIEGVRRAAGLKRALAAEEMEMMRRSKHPLPVWVQDRPAGSSGGGA